MVKNETTFITFTQRDAKVLQCLTPNCYDSIFKKP